MRQSVVHLSGTPGDAQFHLPKKVQDGKIIEFYKRPSITCTIATYDTLIVLLNRLRKMSISEALETFESNFLLREEREILRVYADAGWGDLMVGEVFDLSKFA